MTGDVTRWRRYGKDRLYVTAADGTKLGYRDLVTGQHHLTRPTREAEFAAAVTSWPGHSAAPAGPAPALRAGAPLPDVVADVVVPEPAPGGSARTVRRRSPPSSPSSPEKTRAGGTCTRSRSASTAPTSTTWSSVRAGCSA